MEDLQRKLIVQVGVDSDELVVLSHKVEKLDNYVEAPRELQIPDGLSTWGLFAAAAIYNFLLEEEALHAGGCKMFYSPQEWRDRKEDHGVNAELIVCHDGGAHAPYFSLDCGRYSAHDRMDSFLRGLGLMMEQCTTWYSAIYKA